MRRVRLISLVLEFTWTGLVSLGGGRSAYFYDSVVARRGWVSADEFVQDLTLSQIMPGPTFANLAVALGLRLAGWWGAALALVSVVLPGATILVGLSALYLSGLLGGGGGGAWLSGMGAAVVALVALTTARLTRASIRDRTGLLVAALTFVAVGPLGLGTVPVIAVMAAVSGWLHRPARLRADADRQGAA
jgi:chromate transporter